MFAWQRSLNQKMQEYERLCQRECQLTKGKLIPRGSGTGNHGLGYYTPTIADIRTKSMEDVLDSNDISLIVSGKHRSNSNATCISSPLKATSTLPRVRSNNQCAAIDSAQPSTSHSYDCLQSNDTTPVVRKFATLNNSKSAQNLCKRASSAFNPKIYPPKSDPNIAADDRDFVTRL